MANRVERDRQSGGIQSLQSALDVLEAMVRRGGPASLTDLARDCGIQPSKAHRYLTTFQRAGLVSQTSRSGKYDLGPTALKLGLAAIARHDFVNKTADGLPELSGDTAMTALLSIWGSGGPTVVRWERSASPTITSMGLGTTLPLLNSATGRAFLAWSAPAPIKAACDAQLRLARRNPSLIPDITPTSNGIKQLIAKVRRAGYASVDGRFIPGLVAIAAPVLDWQKQAQAVVTLIGTDPAAIAPRSRQVARLIAYCRDKSVGPDSD